MRSAALERLAAVAAGSGLAPPGSRGIVLVSGGADSACAAAALVEHCGATSMSALHVNYGLRPDSDADEAACRALCAALRIDLGVARPRLGEGNLQALARDARYEAADLALDRAHADWYATGHTRTDVAETVIARLATSRGRRALLGMPARRGALIRPLLALGRTETRKLAAEAGLPFRDDSSNAEPAFQRNRIRHEVLPVLRALNPAAEANIAETRAELAEEAAVLERLAAEALEVAGAGGAGGNAVLAAALAGLDPAVRRLALRRLAERVAGRDLALGRGRAADVWRLANSPEGGVVELGHGFVARCEHGTIRITPGEFDAPAPASLAVPGSCRFGRWQLRAELGLAPAALTGPDFAALDPGAVGEQLVVRSWRDGDSMQPLGLGGSKSLQDLFTDRKVPRSLRHELPLVTAGGRIAWVAGVAVSEEFRLAPGAGRAAVISAQMVE